MNRVFETGNPVRALLDFLGDECAAHRQRVPESGYG